jgi:hypothetical protein
VTYYRVLHLYKSDTERLRIAARDSSRNTKWNPVTNTKWNTVHNPVNNAKCHDKTMTWKVKEALFDDHSPQTKTCHTGNVTTVLSSPEEQDSINTSDVVIH